MEQKLHYALVKSFILMHEYAAKAMNKRKPTKLNVQLNQSTKRAISAYMALINQNKLGLLEEI